jgi:O-antigen/teichoic acid export membrane protein
MANEMKSLAKETVFYGIGSVLPRLLTWFLGLYWAFAFTRFEGIDAPTNIGVLTNFYAYMGLFQVILTYGMETGFFRFANKSDNPTRVFSTTFISVAITTLSFFLLILLFREPVSQLLSIGNAEMQPHFLLLMAMIVCFDVLAALPFASLRYKKRPIRFATIRIVNVSLTVAFNLFFFFVCPLLKARFPDAFSWFDMQNGVEYILISNLAASIIQFLLVSPELRIKFSFDKPLLMNILRYSFPMMILGIAGILNQTVDRLIFPFIYPDSDRALSELGIYAQNYKIATIMVMFAAAFRLAFDPFIFARNKGTKDERQSFADATKYFILLGLFIFLFTTGYIDLLKYLIPKEEFHVGLKIIPIVLLGELFFGVYFNLSLWYKLTDKTRWGAYMALFGLVINLCIIVLFVPHFSYIAMAWAGFIANFIMMTISYFLGQKNYPIPYNLKTTGFFFTFAIILFAGFILVSHCIDNLPLRLIINSFFIALYLWMVVKKELPLSQLPVVRRFFRK